MEKITLSNIKSFLTGYSRKFWKEYLSDIVDFPPHIQAQVMERIKLIEKNSPECLRENACQKCGHKCTVDALIYDNQSCAGNCFPPMKSKEDWEIDTISNNLDRYSEEGMIEAMFTERPIPIIIIPESANLADLMQNNPTLTKEELLYWLPEFKDK